MTFPRYPKYKDSGVEWLGEVPEHWGTTPLKAVASYNDDVVDEGTPPDDEIIYVDISSVDALNGISAQESMRFADAPSRARRRVRDGDVIVSTVRTYLKAIACIREPEANLIVSTGFAVIRPRPGLVPGFAGYLLSASYFVEQVIAWSTGVSYPAINASVLVGISVAISPLAEQVHIAAFLDRETAKIDALVAEQQRLIELLKEKRQAVISHAVTKGLNPDAPMKDSGIEWLGEVPAHWAATRLKHATSLIVDCPHETPTLMDDGDYLTIRTSDIDLGAIFPEQMRAVDHAEYLNRIRREALLRDDIVYSREGGRWGHAALVPEDGRFCLGQRMMQFRANSRFVSGYIMWHLNATNVYVQGDVDTVGAASPHVNVGTIANYRIAGPPFREQTEIAAHLHEELAKLDTLTTEALRAIDLLQERRSALISAAVTGQIDVRPTAERASA